MLLRRVIRSDMLVAATEFISRISEPALSESLLEADFESGHVWFLKLQGDAHHPVLRPGNDSRKLLTPLGLVGLLSAAEMEGQMLILTMSVKSINTMDFIGKVPKTTKILHPVTSGARSVWLAHLPQGRV